jgi:hypothetical protein
MLGLEILRDLSTQLSDGCMETPGWHRDDGKAFFTPFRRPPT